MALPPGSWIGILGGGQLGRMTALEARRMGYRVVTWTGSPGSLPAKVADIVLDTPFSCPNSLERFCARAQVATVEFENIPRELLDSVAARIPLFPGSFAVGICQHREREKNFLAEHQIPCAPFAVVDSAGALAQALKELGPKAVLKTAEFGYDGKGQVRMDAGSDPEEAWASLKAPRGVLEQWVDFQAECSILVARGADGGCVIYDPTENEHRRGILHRSLAPAALAAPTLDQARFLALRIAEKLDYVGVLAVEFFVTHTGEVWVNEMAPRPHNSGHHTLDACRTSQFEQQVRAICGLPLGDPSLLCPAVMWNLLGDLWVSDDQAPDWTPVLAAQGAALHLYGKEEGPVGRKMGHVTFLASRLEDGISRMESVSAAYSSRL